MNRTTRISISITKDDLNLIDDKRGLIDRSTYLRELYRIGMREKGILPPEETTTKKLPTGGLRRAF